MKCDLAKEIISCHQKCGDVKCFAACPDVHSLSQLGEDEVDEEDKGVGAWPEVEMEETGAAPPVLVI